MEKEVREELMRIENTLEEDWKLAASLEVAGKKFNRVILREVIGYDEEAISQPKFKDKPTQMYIELISRCIAEVPGTDQFPTRKELKDLPIGVLDGIILVLRRLSVGEDIEIRTACPNENCKKPYEDLKTIDELPQRKGSYDHKIVPLDRGVIVEGKKLMKAKVKPVDGHIQEEFIAKNDYSHFGELNTDLLYSCIVDIDGVKPTREMIQSMTRKDRKALSTAITDFPGPDVQIPCKCGYCGREFTHRVNPLDFLA